MQAVVSEERPSRRNPGPRPRRVNLSLRPRSAVAPDLATDQMVPQLLPSLFDDLQVRGCLTVLDVGAARPESVRFFSGTRCRLHFADLFGETGFRRRHHARRLPNETLFERIFEFPRDCKFDVCFFWDFLNYLQDPLMRDFAKTLRNHIHDGTRAHAFAAFSNALPFTGLRYGLTDLNCLSVKPDPEPVPHPHTRKAIGLAMWPFSVRRAALLEENRQELLMDVRRI